MRYAHSSGIFRVNEDPKMRYLFTIPPLSRTAGLISGKTLPDFQYTTSFSRVSIGARAVGEVDLSNGFKLKSNFGIRFNLQVPPIFK